MTATGTFIFICSACGYKARLPEEFSGRTIKCPGCQVPQLAKAQVNTERKTASFTRVAATPMPFTLPKEQDDLLAKATAPTVVVPVQVVSVQVTPLPPPAPHNPIPSPLPGAIQITSERIAKAASAVPAAKAAETIDFECSACHARMRLPAHYEGKSILCPKCSAPQRVLTTLPEPMATTRAVIREVPAGTVSSGSRQAVRVTPLPRTYPTPLPTAMAAPTTAAITAHEALAPLSDHPVAELASAPAREAAVAEHMAAMTMAIMPPAAGAPSTAGAAEPSVDAELGSSSGAFSKPHPSRGKVPTVAVRKPVEPVPTAAQPVAHQAAQSLTASTSKPHRSPIGLIIALGLLGLLVIGLGAGLVSYKLAHDDARARLVTAEAAATSAAQREQTATARIKDLAEQVAVLELKIMTLDQELAAEKAKAASEPAITPVKPATPEPPAAPAPDVQP